MVHPRARITRVLLWTGLVLLALRPLGPVERLVETAVAPLRLVTGIASPLKLLRRSEVNAAEERLAASSAEEAEESLRLLLDLVRYARPSEPALSSNRRLVPGEVLGRVPRQADLLRVRVRDVRGLGPGMPVACGDAYVGRVAEVIPEDRTRSGIIHVELVTAADFHVGARVEAAVEGQDVLMTVGGLAGAEAGRRARYTDVRLAVAHPSERDLTEGLARVHELFAEAEEYSSLAEGLRLGQVVRDRKGAQWWIEPELDYKDGLFWVVVHAPLDPNLPRVTPVEDELFEAEWVRVTPLAVGDASPWREAVRVSGGRNRGIATGAAVTATGSRLVGRVGRVGPWTSDVSFLGDPGFSVVAVARLEGVDQPQVLGRLVSLGRDRSDGRVVFRWVKRVELALPEGMHDQRIPARLYSGAGDTGLQCGYYLGEGVLPRPDEERLIRLSTAAEPRDLRVLYVRTGAKEQVQ